jgi:hydrogenase/urease accessory protein HupE
MLRRTLVLLVWCACAVCARAHQPGLSHLAIQLRTNSLESDLTISWQELENVVLLDSDGNRELSNDEFAAAKARLLSMGEGAVSLEVDGKTIHRASTAVQREDSTGIRFVSQWDGITDASVLLVRSEIIADLQNGHRQILSVRGVTNALLAEYSLTRDRNTYEVPLCETTGRDHTITQFLWLGIEHILMGWDHLTFLLGLLVVGGKLRDAVKIITSFTVAHSLTLILATFNQIRLPSTLVEIVIAASIIYVGVENIVRHSYRGRWILTFIFGLIHGCGFATALRELGVGRDGGAVLKPLLSFNAGVELGQLAIAAAVLPWIWKLKPTFERWWIPATSTIVALLGAWFLAERTILAK